MVVENAPRKSGVPVWAWVAGGVALLLCVCVGVVGFFGYIGWQANEKAQEQIDDLALPTAGPAGSWQRQLAGIDGVRDYLAGGQLSQNHAPGAVVYPQQPPVGGDHNAVWQTCSGVVYDVPVPSERAVHSLEHGAVWITYRPGLDSSEVRELAQRVTGRDYLMLSPFPGQDAPISLQAWGYQLKVERADDPRIARFIVAAARNAAPELGAPCSGGTLDTAPLGATGTSA